MKTENPSPEASGAFLFEAQSAYYRYILLRTALQNGVFDLLKTPHTAARMAGELGRDEEIVARLLSALYSMGLVQRDGPLFSNGAAAARFCVRSSPECLADVIGFNDRFFGEVMRRRAALLSPPEAGDGQWDPDAFSAGVDAGRAFLRAGAVAQIADLLSSHPAFAGCRSLLDWGCGSGLLSLELAETRPDIRPTLVDMEPVLVETRAIAEEYGCSGRVSLIAADIFGDVVPGNYDVIIASDSLYGGPDLDGCLASLRGMVHPGGLLLLRHLETACDGQADEPGALLRFGGALVGMPGYVFPAGAIPAALARTGWRLSRSLPLPYLGYPYVAHLAEPKMLGD